MFSYFTKSLSFPFEDFRSKIKTWLVFEKETLGEDFPREGTGCWHNVFPARNDDIQIFGAIAVKFIEDCLQKSAYSDFTVFEQVVDKDNFVGVRRRNEPN